MNALTEDSAILKVVRQVVWLSWFTIGYNLLEGAVAIYFGIEEDSMALAGFGGDSLIEVASACLVLWRFKNETIGTALDAAREKRATLGIGLLFLALSFITLVGSLAKLLSQTPPTTTIPGLVISSISLSFMFYLWHAKKKRGHILNSSTVLKDAACSLACIKLSVTLLVGSLIFELAPGLWWIDSMAALVLSFLIAKEGLEIIKAVRDERFSGGCGCARE